MSNRTDDLEPFQGSSQRRYHRRITDPRFRASTGTHSTIHAAGGIGSVAHQSFPEGGSTVRESTVIVPVPYHGGDPFNDSDHFPGSDVRDAPMYSVAAQLTPPARPRIGPIALPPLSPDIPIHIHILITHSPFTTPILWDAALPPSTARRIDGGRLFHDVAVMPMLSSFVIRIEDVARPVVVFPIEAGGPIRIVDILRAVYNAVRAEVLEHSYDARSTPVYETGSSASVAFLDAAKAEAQVIRSHLRNRSWWGGLSASVDELDVWDLHLMRGPTGRAFY